MVITELQTRFGIRKRQYFEKRFSPAYSTAFRVPETRMGKKKFFFRNSIRRSLIEIEINSEKIASIGNQYH